MAFSWKIYAGLGGVLAALALSVAAVAVPSAYAGEKPAADRGGVTVSKTAPEGTSLATRTNTAVEIAPDTAVCVGPYYVDPWSELMDCNVITTTTFTVTCSDGWKLIGTVPPGYWYVIADCYPASVANWSFQ